MNLTQLIAGYTESDLSTSPLTESDYDAILESVKKIDSNDVGLAFSSKFILGEAAKQKGISVIQEIFNSEVNRVLKSKAVDKHNSDNQVFIDTRMAKAQHQREQKRLVSAATKAIANSTFIKPTKTNINKLVNWSPSRHAEYRKSEVIDTIYLAATKGESEPTIDLLFSSGSCSERGSLLGSGSYRLIKVLGVCLFLDERSNSWYRFKEDHDNLLCSLNLFEFDDELETEFAEFESSLPPELPF